MANEIVSMFMENIVDTIEDAVEDIVEDIVDGVEDIVDAVSDLVPHVQIMVRARDVEFMMSLGWKKSVDELEMPKKEAKKVEKPKETKKISKTK